MAYLVQCHRNFAGGLSMKTCSRCLETKDEDFFYKRSASKDGLNSKCKVCQNEHNKIWLLKNPEKRREISQKWRLNNPEKQKNCEINYRKNNPEKRKKSSSDWATKNKASRKEYIKLYIRENKGIVNANTAMRRARKKQATPAWANPKKIKIEYDLAAWCSKVTGEQYHVDHIVPLQSKLVCGLHWEGNLQVIPAFNNHSKNNRYWDDMP